MDINGAEASGACVAMLITYIRAGQHGVLEERICGPGLPE